MVKKIPKQVMEGLGEIVRETGMEILRETGKIGGLVEEEKTSSHLGGAPAGHHPRRESGEDFDPVLGKINKVNPELLEKYKKREEEKNKEEIARLQSQVKKSPRNVEEEMEIVRQEKDKKEEEEERFWEEIKRKKEEEEEETLEIPAGKQARGTAFLRGKKRAAGTDELAGNKD